MQHEKYKFPLWNLPIFPNSDLLLIDSLTGLWQRAKPSSFLIQRKLLFVRNYGKKGEKGRQGSRGSEGEEEWEWEGGQNVLVVAAKWCNDKVSSVGGRAAHIHISICMCEEGEEEEAAGKSGERNWSAQYTKNRNIINLQAIKRSQKWRKAKGEQYAKKRQKKKRKQKQKQKQKQAKQSKASRKGSRQRQKAEGWGGS